MLVDFNHQTKDRWHAEICVVGGGPVGIALALGLARQGVSTLLLESGGLDAEPDSQALYGGQTIGQAQSDPMFCRLRYLGGTSGHWQGWTARLDEDDLSARPHVPHSGWPIDLAELAPYYSQAEEFCELSEDVQPPGSAWSGLDARLWRFSPPTRFGSVYRRELETSDRLTGLLHANVVEIVTTEGHRVQELRVRSLAGREARVSARHFVLATGGMENARLLLQPTEGHPNGVANGSGWVGRGFMQHIELPVAKIATQQPADLLLPFRRQPTQQGHMVLPAADRRSLGLLNTGFAPVSARELSEGYVALRNIWKGVTSDGWRDDLDQEVGTLLDDIGGAVSDLYSRAMGEAGPIYLTAWAEQAPNADSRIKLAHEQDALGLRRLVVDWRLSELDFRSLRESTLAVGARFAAAGLGRLQLVGWLADEEVRWPERIWSGCHHMGTTRMSDDPSAGVVDRDCRAHDVSNLFVAGSSVFPTGGYVMPTLTAIALAGRLADHLKGLVR